MFGIGNPGFGGNGRRMGVSLQVVQEVRGRGAVVSPTGRFERFTLSAEEAQLTEEELADAAQTASGHGLTTNYYVDASKSALAWNDSPDIPFSASLNPYRGCAHGCAYCYARNSHEFLGLSAGLDFETKIFVKPNLPDLLAADLAARSYTPVVIAMSGITDAYQPVERRLGISRKCLEVLTRFRNPVTVITKNHLVTRDIDYLQELAATDCARVDISITTLDPTLSAAMEPQASSPVRRLAAVEKMAKAGIPVGVFACPVIPGLTDHETPDIVKAAANAGARWVHMMPLRLPGNVAVVFEEWLQAKCPDRAEKVLNRVRAVKGGRLNDPRFGHRFKATGIWYEQWKQALIIARRKAGLENHGPALTTAHFRVPGRPTQLGLFGQSTAPQPPARKAEVIATKAEARARRWGEGGAGVMPDAAV